MTASIRQSLDPPPDDGHLAPVARRVLRRSLDCWGPDRPTIMVGRDATFVDAMDRVERLARAEGSVLVRGETGTGKELFARALHLLGSRPSSKLVAVNCAQFVNNQLMASELFGHTRGSFTGAVADHTGVFEAAEGGTVFLDEIGELTPAAQAMLLRALGQGEILPVGSTRPRRIDVRVVAATRRDLTEMVAEGSFREDLYFRLRTLRVEVPSLRTRGSDWELISDYHLERLTAATDAAKVLATGARRELSAYAWPGNVRELLNCIETGFHMSDGAEIEMRHLGSALEDRARSVQARRVGFRRENGASSEALLDGTEDFWEAIYTPFMNRDLNRYQVRRVIREGLRETQGSYKHLVARFGLDEDEYQKFMDFLRHHDLKPSA